MVPPPSVDSRHEIYDVTVRRAVMDSLWLTIDQQLNDGLSAVR